MSGSTTRTARRALAVVGAVSVVVALSACSSPQASAPGITSTEVRVGTHAPLTGADSGAASISAATKAYFDYVNARGGVNGRKIVFDVEDDASDPATASKVVTDLVEQKQVFAVIGGYGTAAHAAVVDQLNRAQVPDLFVESGSPQWDDVQSHPWTYGFDVDYIVQAKVLASYEQKKTPGATMCLLSQGDDYGRDFSSGLVEILGPSGLTSAQSYTTADTDLTRQISGLKAAGCTVDYLATTNAFTALALTAAAELDYHPTWLAASPGGDAATIESALGGSSKLTEGLLSTDYLPWGTGDRWVNQFKVINEQYGKGAFDENTVLGMSVGYAFVEALQQAGVNPTRADLTKALESGRVVGDGLMPFTYTATNHSAYTGAGITQVQNGEQAYIGHPYLAAHGGSQVIDYYGKGIPFSPNGMPKSQ